MTSMSCRGPAGTGIGAVHRVMPFAAARLPTEMTSTLPPSARTRRGVIEAGERCLCSAAACLGVCMPLTLSPR